MAYLIKDRIQFEWAKCNFDLTFPGPVVQLLGDSGTGKTLFWHSLSGASKELKSLSVLKVIPVNYNLDEDTVVRMIQNEHKSLFVIDNADIVITKTSSVDEIYKSDNQFILMGRNPMLYRVPDNCIGFMEREGRRFTIDYLE